MTTPRETDLTERLASLLQRLSPPRSIAANPEAQRAEVAALLRSVLSAAPSQGYADWWGRFEDALMRRMKTRAWPILSEVQTAARDIAQAPGQAEASGSMAESAAIARMADWFEKFRSQMPSHGRASRTQALIAAGVLHDEREAGFYGFDLDEPMTARARDQAPGAIEAKHHRQVLENLRAINSQIEANKAAAVAMRGAA